MAYTYEEFLKFPENFNDKRYEAINREVYEMASPSTRHQTVCDNISNIFGNFLKGKHCKLCVQPFDVFLGEDVVVPDLSVVCDRTKITKKGCVGSPDLVVEILSPSTLKKDMTIKTELYRKNKVKEYWMIFPLDGYVVVHVLNALGSYDKTEYSDEDTIYPSMFPEFPVKLRFVFSEEFDRHEVVEYFKMLLDI